jgi:prepilin-type N-terminal cleavage/methylation domain-containing protein
VERKSPSRSIDARERGYTFIEVLVGLLLASVIATAVLSVAVTTKIAGGYNSHNDRRMVAGQIQKELTSVLKNFVTACCDPVSGTCNPAGAGNCGGIAGPNGGAWTLNGYPFANNPSNGFGGAVDTTLGANPYALQVGAHNLNGSILPTWFSAAPYNATVSYTVTAGPSYNNVSNPITWPPAGDQVIPQVNVTVNWTEP